MSQHERWTDRLSDYVDGTLPESQRPALEAHVAGCQACRALSAELAAIVEGAGSLPVLEPPRDLWPEIVEALGAPVEASGSSDGDGVLALPVQAAPVGRGGSGGLVLSVPQLAVAAMLLIVFSVTATWFAGPGLAVQHDGQPVQPSLPVVMTSGAPAPPQALAPEIAALEEVLEGARSALEPNTVRILERNLAVVERAIEDSYRALAIDPENAFLASHLEQVFERKLEYLREAVRVVEWSG